NAAATYIDGIHISDVGTNNNVAQGNYIGTDVTGSKAIPNGGAGVSIIFGAQSNVVGGVVVGARNIIAGNTNAGVFIGLGGANANVVQGNYLGLNAGGTASLPSSNGVWIMDGATANVVGGTVSGAGNVIVGHSGSGVWLTGRGTIYNVVRGNSIGKLDPSGHTLRNSNGVAITNGAQFN